LRQCAHCPRSPRDPGGTIFRPPMGRGHRRRHHRGALLESGRAKRRTLADAIDRYVKTVLPRKPKSASAQQKQLQWWRAELGHLVLADLTAARIAAARDRLLTTKDNRGRTRGGRPPIVIERCYRICFEWPFASGSGSRRRLALCRALAE